MKLFKPSPLPFREGRLYDDIDIHEDTIVNAQYTLRKDYADNPDVCAIPRLLETMELVSLCQMPRPGYDRQEVEQMPAYARKEAILSIQDAYYFLGHYLDIACAVDKALLTAYMGRELRVSSDEGGVILSVRDGVHGRPTSFVLIGQTGCGKTVAMNQIKRLYPSAIRHTLDGHEYVQVPILMTTSKVGNLRELIISLGDHLDEILDSGTIHASQVRRGNLGIACNTLSRWVKKYHIGIVLIDEFEYMNLKGGNGSLENIVSISEETGCALGLIGNPDGKEKLLKHPRLVNRVMQSTIEVGCSGQTAQILFTAALEGLWTYQFGEKYVPLTGGLRIELLHQSLYNISLLKAAIMDIQYRVVKEFPKDGITPAWVSEVCTQDFATMRALLLEGTPETDVKALEMIREAAEKIRIDAENEKKEAAAKAAAKPTGEFSDQNRYKLKTVEAILTYLNYPLPVITNGIRAAANADPELEFSSPQVIARTVQNILEKANGSRPQTTTEKKADPEMEAAVKGVLLNGEDETRETAKNLGLL